MENDKPFFMRDPWIYDFEAKQAEREDADLGLETRTHGMHLSIKTPNWFGSKPPA